MTSLVGTVTLLRFALRRDRIRLPLWIVGVVVTVAGTTASFPDLYAAAADRQARAGLMTNPAAIAMSGPRIGLDDYTFGAMLTNEVLGFAAVLAAMMSLLLVVRHTRTDEEAGRAELVRASVVGRHAPLAATLALALGANLVLAVVTAVSLAGLGIESIDASGSWLFAAAVAVVGVVFAAVAAITVQITEHARGAAGLAGLVLGVAFAMRAAGDIGSDALSWVSPIGWAQRTSAFVDDRWWPVLLAVGVAAVLASAAVVLSARRDLGAGLRPSRPGAPRASAWLGSPWGLAVRLHRASLVGWTVAAVALGITFGSLVGEVEGFAAELEAMQDLFAGAGADLTDGFLGLAVAVVALLAGAYAASASLRARGEETAGRAEPVLATAVSRTRWVASHLVVAAVGGALVLLAGTLGLAVTTTIVTGDGGAVATLLGAASVHLAPVVCTVAIAAALLGLVPAASAATWLVVGYGAAVTMLGGLLGLPAWMSELSPFGAVPMLPAETFTAVPVVVLVALAIGLSAAGIIGFRRRDVTAGA